MDWFPIASFALNLLLLPLLAILWDMRIKLAVMESRVCSQGTAIIDIKRRLDAHLDQRPGTA